jgi:signal transduction histidine kinase
MREYWKLIQPGYLFSWPVFIPVYLWALLVHFSDSILNAPGDYLSRFFIVTSLHLMFFGLLYLAKILYLDRIKPSFVPIALIATIVWAAAVRGYLFQAWLFAWGIDDQPDADLRVKSSILNMLIATLTSLIAYANSQRRNLIYSELLMENSRLELVKADLNQDFAKGAIDSSTEELRRRLGTLSGMDQKRAAESIKSIIEEVVSPLSRNLETTFTHWTPPIQSRQVLRINWREVLSESFRPQNVNYRLIPFLLVFIASPIILANTPLLSALLQQSLTVSIGVVVGNLFQRLYRNRQGRIWEYFLITSITGLAMGISSLNFTRNYSDPQGFLRPAVIYYVLLASILSVLRVAELKRRNLTLQLEQTKNELEWQIARVKDSQRLRYKGFARHLHGPVQAHLTKMMFQLQGDGDRATKDRFLEEATKELEEMLSDSAKIDAPKESLSEVFMKVRDTWKGLVEISFDIPNGLLEAIESDPLCGSALIDVVPELIFNSIRHGKASHVQIRFESPNADFVRLTITDNGAVRGQSASKGLGTRMLDESSISWARSYEDGQSVTTALFAYRANTMV